MGRTAVVFVGIDIGQRRDPTAIAVAEAESRPTGNVIHSEAWHREHPISGCREAPYCRDEVRDFFDVRTLGRLPLGTPYPKVAAELAHVVRRLNDRDVKPTVRIDVTGVGRPVFDELANELRVRRCDARLIPATFVAGDSLDRVGGELRVGKARLVSRLQALLTTRRVALPRLHRQAKAMARELETFEIRVNENANMIAGAFSTGAHDDLVTALGLAVLTDPSAKRVTVGPTIWR